MKKIRISRKLCTLFTAILLAALFVCPVFADESEPEQTTPKVYYTLHYMYPNSVLVDSSYLLREDKDTFFIEYKGKIGNETIVDNYANPVITAEYNQLITPEADPVLCSAWAQRNPGYQLVAQSLSVSKSSDTNEDLYADINVYCYSTQSSVQKSLITVNHEFQAVGSARTGNIMYQISEGKTDIVEPSGSYAIANYTLIYKEYKYDDNGKSYTPDYYTTTSFISDLENYGFTVTKPQKKQVVFGTDSEVTYKYTVSDPNDPTAVPTITYTVKHLYPKDTSVKDNTDPSKFITYDGTFNDAVLENDYEDPTFVVNSGEKFSASANEKLIKAYEAANKGYTLTPTIYESEIIVSQSTQYPYNIYYLPKVITVKDCTVNVIHTFRSDVSLFSADGNTYTNEISYTIPIAGKEGETKTADLLTDFIKTLENAGYKVTSPQKKTVTLGKDKSIEYVYTVTVPQNGTNNDPIVQPGSVSVSITNLTTEEINRIIQTINAGNTATIKYGGYTLSVVKDENGGIGIASFSGSGRIVIPDSIKIGSTQYLVTSIKAYAFSGNKLITEVVLGKNIVAIEEGAFQDCTSLRKVIFNNGLATIGDNAFKGCTSLEEFVAPSTLTSIGESAFEGCKSIKRIVLNEGLLSITKKSFKGCSGFSQLKIPASVLELEASCFENCKKIKTVTFAASSQCLAIRQCAFKGCTSLTKITIPKSVDELEKKAFYGCSKLNKVSGMAGLITIGDQVFMKCTSLKSFTIAKNVQEIGKKAFNGCKKLGKIKVSTKFLQTVKSGAFKNIKKNAKFTIAAAKKNEYKKLLEKNCDSTAKF